MSINFCTNTYQPIFQCFQMQLEGYSAENLSKDFAQNHGFLADPLQRPPVDIYIRFPLNFDLQHIYLSPSISRHRSTWIEILVNHQWIDEKTSWLIDRTARENLIDVKQLLFHRIIEISNRNETIRRIEIYDDQERTSSSSSSTNTNDIAIYRFSSLRHLNNCSSIKISIKGTTRGSSCVLKYLQIWGKFSSTSPIHSRLEEIFHRPTSRSVVSSSSSPRPTSSDIPTEFLDALTCDLMIIPMLLPSGYLIDRQTLEKCIAEDQRWSRSPRDPFTLTPFTEITQPVVAQQLKIRIDQFLSENNDRSEYRQYGRVLDPSNSIENNAKRRKYDDEK